MKRSEDPADLIDRSQSFGIKVEIQWRKKGLLLPSSYCDRFLSSQRVQENGHPKIIKATYNEVSERAKIVFYH